jgi:hypothetical protein
MLRARKLVGATLTACLVSLGGVATTVASAGAAHAATCTASQYAADLNKVGKRAESLLNRLQALNTSSTSAAVQAEAAATVRDLNDMIVDLGTATMTLNECGPLAAANTATVTAALDNLTALSQATLATVIGKHSIFAQFQQTAPIAATLRSLEAALDSYSIALITVAPTAQPEISAARTALDTAVGNTINVYSQICIPSPLYPIIMPVCVAS